MSTFSCLSTYLEPSNTVFGTGMLTNIVKIMELL